MFQLLRKFFYFLTSIIRFEQISEGIFKSHVPYYIIETDTFAWKVKRKFEWFT